MPDETPPRRYPAMPAYGQPTGPVSGPPPVVTTPEPAPGRTSGVGLAIGMSLGFNALTLVGVLVFGWPPGNIFLLFWLENLVLGVCTLIKVVTAQAPSTQPLLLNGRPTKGSPGLFAVFFLFHYGLFCTVHLVFTVIVAIKIGVEPTFLLLGFPLILIVLRYGVETVTTWFGRGQLRHTTAPGQAMMQPYPRIIVLQFAVILAFTLVLDPSDSDRGLGALRGFLEPLLPLVPEQWRTNGVAAVAVLVMIKTVVDVLTTRRALRQRSS